MKRGKKLLKMNNEKILKTANYVKKKLSGESSGHDWWHVYRVWNLGKKIAISEKVDLNVVELTCLLHDISDWKFNDGDDNIGPKLAREYLEKINVKRKVVDSVSNIIKNLSFKGANVENSIITCDFPV